jgi:hypothetical protein
MLFILLLLILSILILLLLILSVLILLLPILLLFILLLLILYAVQLPDSCASVNLSYSRNFPYV